MNEARELTGVVGLRFMRDPTRGGLATVAHEIARATGLGVRLVEADGRLFAATEVIALAERLADVLVRFHAEHPLEAGMPAQSWRAAAARDDCDAALTALRRVAPSAALIGEIRAEHPQVVLETSFGGQRALDELEDDPLPRIC